jgi:tRNA G10  N-methylase Trm11
VGHRPMQADKTNSAPDLDFSDKDTLYATHGLHAFAAKCPPQLARFGITTYSAEGETVLDPMAGSGTTLVEARLLGRSGIGYDLDPLACLISQVKSRPVDDRAIADAAAEVVLGARADLAILASADFGSEVLARATAPDFLHRDYWFSADVSRALAILTFHIGSQPMPESIREFLWVVFSSVILAKVSVANARDIIHSRHHHLVHEMTPNVVARFEARVKIMRKQMAAFRQLCNHHPDATVKAEIGDARCLPVPGQSVDLVLTSPPYATALDYPRAHFLAVAWMQQILGTTLEEYLAHGLDYIGSERGHVGRATALEPGLTNAPSALATIERLQEVEPRQAALVQRYFLDMNRVVSEISRVLRPGRHAFIVICPSHIRKVEVPTHRVFTEMATHFGLRQVHEYTRTINGRRRILPYMREAFGERMKTEYVLIYKKASAL